MYSACFEPGPDAVCTSRAADWACAFYPDLEIEVEPKRILVSSDRRSEIELSLIWKAALANEKLQAQGKTYRDAVLGELLA